MQIVGWWGRTVFQSSAARARGCLPRANLAASLLLSAAAGLQYNDPDPLRWILLYGGAALVCLAVARSPRCWPIAALLGGLALAWSAALWPALRELRPLQLVESMQARGGLVEEGRESLGLLIVALWMAVLVVVARRAVRPSRARLAL